MTSSLTSPQPLSRHPLSRQHRSLSSTRTSPATPVVHLHIGTMKTGTTYLQSVLTRHREQLAEQGVLFPGETWRHQVRAVQDVMGSTHGDPTIRAQADGAWRALTREVLRHRGPSVVSMEFLSHAGPEQARRVMSSLGEAEVHVVLTVRDAAGTVPAQWQTMVRNGSTLSWPEFRRGARRATGRRARPGRLADPAAVKFRHAQDVARMLEVWRRFVPAERIHVVTVPDSGGDRSLLWQRFSGVVGLDPRIGAQDTSVNTSLGYASAELLRLVNAELAGRGGRDGSSGSLGGAGRFALSDYNATVREVLAGQVLAARSDSEARPLLDRRTADFALAWNARTREAVTSTRAHLVGDLADLPVAAVDPSRVDDHQPPPSSVQLLEVAEESVEALRRLVERRAARAVRRGVDVPGEVWGVRGGRGRGGARGATGDAVSEIAVLCREAMVLRRCLQASREAAR
ncbi:hypothetical protein G7072_05955 [Nocardioides sp. HDW12B]|uniref:hypothetical protein n=1 Tax=Nocardioides sp. HDW12B TaxID=2714939 RepID=UPI001408E08F|nr:hypothetical protein [Nocardioides sp. HDW12B]QIK65941.1 hypothetical protein G7072_05955 [Nocardioides sp. HDW12B]